MNTAQEGTDKYTFIALISDECTGDESLSERTEYERYEASDSLDNSQDRYITDAV